MPPQSALPSQERDLLNPPRTIRAVICYIMRGNEILLLLKATGKFGAGFWNAPGGKIKAGECVESAARREVLEETGLSLGSLEKAGDLEFYFGPEKTRPDWTADVFVTREFSGMMRESEEGMLKWFPEDELPFDQMWEDDRYWLPLLIRGKRFHGIFQFSSDSKVLISHNVKEEE